METQSHIHQSGTYMEHVTLAIASRNWNQPLRSTFHGKPQGTVDCNRAIKLDCIGHVQKRLGKALYDFQRSTTKLEDGKPVKGRNGRLTKAAIEKLKKYYGKAVRNNVNRGISTTEERDRAVANMRTEIKVGLYHCSKLPLKERNQYCPSNSWCKYKKGLPCPDKPHHLDPVFFKMS